MQQSIKPTRGKEEEGQGLELLEGIQLQGQEAPAFRPENLFHAALGEDIRRLEGKLLFGKNPSTQASLLRRSLN